MATTQVSDTRVEGSVVTGSCIVGDGASFKVSLSQNHSLPLFTSNTAFTICTWIKLKDLSTTGKTMFTETQNSSSPLIVFDFGSTGGRPRWFVRNNSSTVLVNQETTGQKLLAGVWYHVALVDNNGAWRIYINGVVDPVNSGGNNNYTKTVANYTVTRSTIGCTSRTTDSGFLDSAIKDFRIYTRILSAAELTSIYHNRPISSTGLVRWYKFDEGSGATATDSSASADTVSITGGTYSTAVPNPFIARTPRTQTYNLQIAVGTYTGDGSDNRNITSVGFQPDFVLVRGGTNNTVWRTNINNGDSSMFLTTTTANAADLIQSLLTNGFQIGTNATVNANGTTYYWVAIRGSAIQFLFRTGMYVTKSTNNTNIVRSTIGFTPDVAMIKRDGTVTASWVNSSFPAGESAGFEARADVTNEILGLLSNGFQVGGSNRVNGVNLIMYYAVLKNYSNIISSGSYTGDGKDNRNINIGFQPDFVFMKGASAAVTAVLRTSSFTGDSSALVTGIAPTSNQIQGFNSNGFQLGSSGQVNGNATVYYWFAIKAGNYNIPITRTAV